MRQIGYRRNLFNLQIIRRILTGKPWLNLLSQHANAHVLKRTLGSGLGKLYATGCEGLVTYLSRVDQLTNTSNALTGYRVFLWSLNEVIQWNKSNCEVPASSRGLNIISRAKLICCHGVSSWRRTWKSFRRQRLNFVSLYATRKHTLNASRCTNSQRPSGRNNR